MRSRLMRPEIRHLLVIVVLFTGFRPVMGAGFAAAVSPPRFELRGNPGDVLRDHVDIQNPDNQPVTFLLRTADWDMSEDGSATFYPPALQTGSCRPWSRIERLKILVPPKGSKRFRFEITIPKDAPAGECRLALLIEAPRDEAVVTQANSLTIPVQARVAVVIYVEVGDAAPDLVLNSLAIDEYNGQRTPVAILKIEVLHTPTPPAILRPSTTLASNLNSNSWQCPYCPDKPEKYPCSRRS